MQLWLQVLLQGSSAAHPLTALKAVAVAVVVQAGLLHRLALPRHRLPTRRSGGMGRAHSRPAVQAQVEAAASAAPLEVVRASLAQAFLLQPLLHPLLPVQLHLLPVRLLPFTVLLAEVLQHCQHSTAQQSGLSVAQRPSRKPLPSQRRPLTPLQWLKLASSWHL